MATKLIDRIVKNEDTFFKTGNACGTLFTLTPKTLTGGGESLEVIQCRRQDGTEGWYKETKTKSLMVMHFTAGQLTGDIVTLAAPRTNDKGGTYYVNTAFVLARDGRIYEMFPDDKWAYHLADSLDTANDPRSVAVEISNFGPLKLSGETLTTEGGAYYCDLTDTDHYIKLDAPWREAIQAHLRAGRTLLGICLGLQWLFEGSTESPGLPGLGVLPGVCRRLGPDWETSGPASEAAGWAGYKVPHVGWNTVRAARASTLLHGVPPDAQAYFTHSYAAPIGPSAVAVTTHGPATFASAVATTRGKFGSMLTTQSWDASG